MGRGRQLVRPSTLAAYSILLIALPVCGGWDALPGHRVAWYVLLSPLFLVAATVVDTGRGLLALSPVVLSVSVVCFVRDMIE